MKKTENTVLDYIDNIVVPGDVFKNPVNEYWALIYLREGMDFLYRQAKRCDESMQRRVNPDANTKVMILGNLPALQDIPKKLLTCSFHWYAISACNYVRTIGAIAHRLDNKRSNSLNYLKKIIPDVLVFRDKVAAHFAWSTKNKKDNDADRLISVIPQLTFINDSFHVGAISCTEKKANKSTKSEAIGPWSICKVHKELQKRYWPENENE